MEFLNFDSLKVDANGRASFSGLGSGIDFEKIVSDIITAKRIPIDSIENRIAGNAEKIAALEEMRGLMTSLRQTLSKLRGAVSIGNASNVFAAKQVFATASRSDGGVPSAAGNLLGASATNAATTGSHSIEVRRIATAHKIGSSTFASQTSALGAAGTFEIAGSGGTAIISVQATDTLQDIRDRINNANTGVNGTGVTASIVQASSNQFVLVVTADKTGEPMRITDSGSVLADLGLSTTNGSGGFRTGLAAGASKVDAGDGFKHVLFDGSQGEAAFKISYDQATRVMTLTRGDGVTDTATLSATAIASGATETVTFGAFGAAIVLDSNFDKGASIVVDADTASVTGGTGAIDANTIAITGSSGSVAGIGSTSLIFGNLGTPGAISVSVGAFSGTFDGTSTGLKTVTLADGNGNELTVSFDVTATFSGAESAASIDLQELENLAVSSGTQFENQLQVAQTARLTADGLKDADRFESDFIANRSAALTSIASGSFDIKVGAGSVTVNFTNADTLDTLVGKINTAIAAAGGGNAVFDAGTEASVFVDGEGFRLILTNASGAAISLTDTSGLLGQLGVDNNLVVERKSNTVSDLFTGITLTLFQAEEGTQVKLDIEQNLTAAKTAIQDFVTAYNEVKVFLSTHAQVDSTTGAVTADTGVLFGSPALVAANSRIAAIFANVTEGINEAYSVLRQIGITFLDKGSVDDPLLVNTLEIDDAVLDEALLNNASDVRRLFAFDFSSSDPRVSLLDFTGKTSFKDGGYTLNINFADKYHSQTFTLGGTFTQVDAQDNGPASDGISDIAFDPSVVSGKAYRYSYDAGGENLTLRDLTAGTSQTVNITAILDAAAGTGNDLGAGQTAAATFSTLGVTLTLSGDAGFLRGNDIGDGALDTSDLGANGLTMAGGAVTTPASGLDKATVDALRAAGAYDPTTGLLTLNVDSTGVGDATFDAAAGIKFAVDGGAVGPGPTGNLGDGAAHTLDVYVNDGSADVKVASLTFTSLNSAGAGSGDLTIDLGTGLFGETSTVIDDTAPMENYLAISDGSFEVRDAANTLLGTVNYDSTDSLAELASSITASVPNVSATVIESGGTLKIEILHSNRDVLSFTGDTGGLVAALNLGNAGDGVFAANVDGATNGTNDNSTTVSGRTITATGVTGADGLKVFYAGTGDLSGVQIDVTVGLGARLYSAVNEMLAPGTGLIDSSISTLSSQNEQNQERADAMSVRLDRTRETLLAKFIAMETALARAKSLQEQLQTTFDALFEAQKR